ncbi:helix-turn-helix domain-containing protein [Intestinibacillus massiliensis]|uniref:helix-turn-helix domain-containing protein n=1 Tax=Intestinibacillus massiliensis TaxID=1871029 RepID=UPI000B3523BF|nr:AraC family transcriptional regulator [Intestinibacillus massiliensis]
MFITDENQVEQIHGMTTEYPYCMHEQDLTDIVIPWHWHEEVELGYIEEGASTISTIDAEYVIHQGDGFFINTNVMDMKKNASPGGHTLEINHIFHPVFLSGHFKSLFETKYLNPILNNRQISVHIIRRGQKAANQILNNLYHLRELQAQSDTEFQTRNILSETWLLLIREIQENFTPAAAVPNDEQNRIRSMISFVNQHYAEKLTVAEIAASAGISVREAQRSFRHSVGQSPSDYILGFRLNRAKKLLAESELSITEISYQCGFSDSAYFGKLFLRECNMTPSAFRRMHNK